MYVKKIYGNGRVVFENEQFQIEENFLEIFDTFFSQFLSDFFLIFIEKNIDFLIRFLYKIC